MLIKTENLSKEEIDAKTKTAMPSMIIWFAAAVLAIVIGIVAIVVINGIELITNLGETAQTSLGLAIGIPLFVAGAICIFFGVINLLNIMRLKKA